MCCVCVALDIYQQIQKKTLFRWIGCIIITLSKQVWWVIYLRRTEKCMYGDVGDQNDDDDAYIMVLPCF